MRLFGISAFLLVACGGSQPAPAPPVATVPPAPTASAPVVTASPAPSATPPPPREAFPAPKPTTIALARTGDASLDAQLADADKAFEAGDIDKALTGYEAAKKSAPKKAAPIVG